MDDNKITVKYDFDFLTGGITIAATLVVFVVGVEILNLLGWQRDIFEFIGKWGALIEDGYDAQREINTE